MCSESLTPSRTSAPSALKELQWFLHWGLGPALHSSHHWSYPKCQPSSPLSLHTPSFSCCSSLQLQPQSSYSLPTLNLHSLSHKILKVFTEHPLLLHRALTKAWHVHRSAAASSGYNTSSVSQGLSLSSHSPEYQHLSPLLLNCDSIRHPGNGTSTFSQTVSFTPFCNQSRHCDPS